jgi:hypothetical protein
MLISTRGSGVLSRVLTRAAHFQRHPEHVPDLRSLPPVPVLHAHHCRRSDVPRWIGIGFLEDAPVQQSMLGLL